MDNVHENIELSEKEPFDSFSDSVAIKFPKSNKFYPIRFSASNKKAFTEHDKAFPDLKDNGLYERKSLFETLKYFFTEPDWLMKKMKFPEIAYKSRLKLLIIDNDRSALGKMDQRKSFLL